MGAFGPVAAGDGTLFTLATEGEGLALVEVDATNGSVRGKHPLALSPSAEDRAYTQVVWSAGTVAVSVGPHIGVVTPSEAG